MAWAPQYDKSEDGQPRKFLPFLSFKRNDEIDIEFVSEPRLLSDEAAKRIYGKWYKETKDSGHKNEYFRVQVRLISKLGDPIAHSSSWDSATKKRTKIKESAPVGETYEIDISSYPLRLSISQLFELSDPETKITGLRCTLYRYTPEGKGYLTYGAKEFVDRVSASTDTTDVDVKSEWVETIVNIVDDLGSAVPYDLSTVQNILTARYPELSDQWNEEKVVLAIMREVANGDDRVEMKNTSLKFVT